MDNISINTHSSIRINDAGKVFYFDPFKIENQYNDADYIFVTHDHYDHLDPISIANVETNNTKIICPESIVKKVINDCEINDISKVISVNPNMEIEIEDNIKVKTTYAYNKGREFHKKSYNWVGYILYVDNNSYYVAGDTDFVDELKNIICDVALVPIGGTYTMDIYEAANFINLIRPKVVIPTHYGSIVGDKSDGKKFIDIINSEIVAKELIEFKS